MEIYETQTEEIKPLVTFIQHYSCWYRLQKGIAWLNHFIKYLRVRNYSSASYKNDGTKADISTRSRDEVAGAGVGPLTVDDLQNAWKQLIRYVQQEAFPDEITRLQRRSSGQSTSKIVKLAALSPFLADDGLLRVGGRLDRASISFDAKHPAIIPSKHHIVELLIRHYHEQEGHSGVRSVLSAIREFWIHQGRSRIRWIIGKCVQCRKKYASPCEQIMAPYQKLV